MFLKGHLLRRNMYSQDNFRGIHYFLKIPIVKVLFSNLLSRKGMSDVTYPVRERVNAYTPLQKPDNFLNHLFCEDHQLYTETDREILLRIIKDSISSPIWFSTL
jgi:hypothetical protein